MDELQRFITISENKKSFFVSSDTLSSKYRYETVNPSEVFSNSLDVKPSSLSKAGNAFESFKAVAIVLAIKWKFSKSFVDEESGGI